MQKIFLTAVSTPKYGKIPRKKIRKKVIILHLELVALSFYRFVYISGAESKFI
jgi:hypothetical protein